MRLRQGSALVIKWGARNACYPVFHTGGGRHSATRACQVVLWAQHVWPHDGGFHILNRPPFLANGNLRPPRPFRAAARRAPPHGPRDTESSSNGHSWLRSFPRVLSAARWACLARSRSKLMRAPALGVLLPSLALSAIAALAQSIREPPPGRCVKEMKGLQCMFDGALAANHSSWRANSVRHCRTHSTSWVPQPFPSHDRGLKAQGFSPCLRAASHQLQPPTGKIVHGIRRLLGRPRSKTRPLGPLSRLS